MKVKVTKSIRYIHYVTQFYISFNLLFIILDEDDQIDYPHNLKQEKREWRIFFLVKMP